MTPLQSRIIYVGALWKGSTALHRMLAMHSLGAEVISIDSEPDPSLAPAASLLFRVRHRLAGPWDRTGANAQIIAAAEKGAPDILWIDKGLTIEPSTMRAVRARHPRCLIVGYSPDDMTNRGNQTRCFIEGLPEYDVYFTTKSYGVRELNALGARHAIFIGNAYDPETHRPCTPTMQQRSEFGGVVGFIGQWEAQRSSSICTLALASVPVRAWGQDWSKCRCSASSLQLENRPLWGECYRLALCSFDINLCFLRKSNRDQQTTRSVEIPACGAFMLAERTEEHLALFEEGKEADFFGSDAELVDKVRFYIAHPDVRQAIAATGRERCLRSGYSNQARMRLMLSAIDGLRH